MGFWNRFLGGGKEKPPAVEPSRQLPSSMVAAEFGEVNVKKVGNEIEVLFTILMEPQGVDSEGWQTGVALDASKSMEPVYGRGVVDGWKGAPPQSVYRKLIDRKEITLLRHQGEDYMIFSHNAKTELVAQNYCKWTKNDVEPLARQFTAYLASKLDADGGTTVIYWACGDGSALEVIGDLTADDCEAQIFTGPKSVDFGDSTILTPAVKYFADRFSDAKNGMYVFVTDGVLNDLPEVKKYTISLCKEIAAGKRNPLKCVLVGVGEGIDEGQMEELDDLDSGTDVDIWDHKIAKDMRGVMEIFAEVVSESTIVAPTGRIFDATGESVKQFADGLPARVTFRMPATSTFFELEVAGQRIRQSVVVK
ncbi:MAG: vWA domain-containing protein [Fimbriiglobus sp.]